VVDAAMVDGIALLTTLFHGLRAENLWSDEPESNILDLGAAHYNVYETADRRYVSVGAGEPQFYRELLRHLGLDEAMVADQGDPTKWAAHKDLLAAAFKKKTLAEWCEALEGTNTCFAPVLSLTEAPNHAHNEARGTFVEVDGVVQPAAAPRFSRTQPSHPGSAVTAGRDSTDVLGTVGFSQDEVQSLVVAGVVSQASDGRPS
jgi:alpha-methylacyl-CoA racemase